MIQIQLLYFFFKNIFAIRFVFKHLISYFETRDVPEVFTQFVEDSLLALVEMLIVHWLHFEYAAVVCDEQCWANVFDWKHLEI